AAAPPHVYHRRRALVATAVVVAFWLVAQLATGGFTSGGPESADASPAAPDRRPAAAAPDPDGDRCPAAVTTVPAGDEPVPEELAESIELAMANWGLSGPDTGVALWVEGYGVVVAENADVPLAPASNQKILTAMGALELLDPDERLVTEVRAAGPVSAAGAVGGGLVVAGGGDPRTKRTGPPSIEDLAREIADEGIERIEGDIVGDESRYDQVRRAPGWLDWEMPLPGGAMSALMVNSNSRLGDAAYLSDPTLHNVGLLIEAL